jgi:hypothetical protein
MEIEKEQLSIGDRRMLKPALRKTLDMYAVMSIYGDRLRKIFKERDINVQEWSKENGGSFWFVERFNIERFSDGSHTDHPLCRLTGLLTGSLLTFPLKEDWNHLEYKLGFGRNFLFTHFKKELGVERFLEAVGYIRQDGLQTHRYSSCQRIKNYFRAKKNEFEEMKKNLKLHQERESQKAKEKKKQGIDRSSKLSRLAMGSFTDSDGFEYKEQT